MTLHPLYAHTIMGMDWPVSSNDFAADIGFFRFILDSNSWKTLVDSDPQDEFPVLHPGTRVWVVQDRDTFDSVEDAATAIEEKSDVFLFRITLAGIGLITPLWLSIDEEVRSDMSDDFVRTWVDLARADPS